MGVYSWRDDDLDRLHDDLLKELGITTTAAERKASLAALSDRPMPEWWMELVRATADRSE